MEAAAASELYERTRTEAEFRVPHIDWTRTSASVLTSEWIDGVSVRDTAAIAAGPDAQGPARLGAPRAPQGRRRTAGAETLSEPRKYAFTHPS